MNKRILAFTMLLTATVFAAQANPVDQRTAREAATKFVNANTKVSLRGSDELQLATTYHINRSDAAFYIFNMANGFVIVAADDCAIPILGYSDEGMPFDPNDIPVQMEEYLQGFVEQIQYGVENHIQPDESTTRQWEMVMATGRLNDNRSTNAVEPLLTERWNQGCYYNAMCPEDSQGPCGHTYVGCAAAAMGQIMHYWGYPETGGGSHSYTPSGYPIQSVNFWETTYDWEHMPDELTSSSSNAEVNAVATLLWHCGVSINMMYGHNGSGAYPNAVPAALTEYFNYSSDLYSQNKGDDATWLNLVKSSLDLGRPIHYSGWNGAGGGGHSFVCDGYDSNNQLHFNWGWSGNGNGYFALNALIVSGSNFSYNNYAIFNIHPYEGTETYTITTQSNPAEGGTTTGDGNYNYAHTCTLTATQNENYLFVNWTKNGYQVSSEPICHVTVREDATYVANFRRTNIDEIVIGNATNSSDHLPLTSSNRYSLSQQIYTAEEINANGPITDISFYHAGSLSGSAPLNINLYLKHTQKSSFTSDSDWETLSSDDLCYSGSYLIDGTSGWKQISLETPFNYNGSDNLLVCIDNNTGSNLSNLPWATFESNANLSLTAYSDTLNYNPFSPIGGIIGSFRNQIALTFQVTQGTDFVVTPDPINLGYRPSGCWMRPVSIGLYNSGMTTTISNISSSNSFFTLDTQNIEFPLVFEYHDQAEIQLSTSSGNGLIDASLNISYGNGQTKQTQLFATAYTPAVTDVWETAQEITAFPFSANISNSFLPLYDNYRLPNTDIPDGPDAVYKITLDEETLLSASITNGENGKVALYTENFRGLDGPDTDNSFDSNNPINEWIYYVRLGSNLYHVSSNGNIHWGIMFPVSKLQPYLYTWLTKVALYETPNNMQSITLNIYLGGDSAPGTLVLTQDFMPLSNGIHEIDLNSEILIDGTQNLWITFNQKGDAAPASYAPITTDPNSHWLSSNGITWDNNNSGISFPIQGFFTNATGTTLCMGNSNPRDVNQMDLMPGTYYLVASSTSDNWDLEINTQPIIGPIPASNPNPTHQSSGTDYVETQLSWTLGEGTTEYKVLFGNTPNCEQVLVTWTSDLANSYTFTTDLDWNSTYYWRVCERNSNCPNGISSPLWSFTTGNFVPREREIIASCYPSAGGAVSGAGIYTDGSTCTLTASPYSGYIFKRWADEDGRTISTNNSYSFVVHGNQNLIAIFAHTGNIPFADSNLKARCVARWDANGDGELSYSEAANVTNIGNVFQNKRDFTSFDELQYFTALTSIGYWAFLGCQTMTSITIPRFVSNIANESFYAVYALGSISVVEENTHYDSRNNCNAIIDTRTNQLIVGCKNTVVPNTVTSIGYMAFGDCRNLTSINLPNSIQSIGANAFESCISLGSITLPNSLTSIGNEAFVACNALSSVTIPSSVTNIGLNPFSYCTSLAHINVESGNPRYDSRDNCDAIIETSTNQLILGTPNTMIPNTVTSIAEKAFSGYNNLISITVPRNVTTIGDYAFSGNHNLRSISVLAETPPTLGAEPFRFLDKNLIAIHVPCELTSTYQSASGWSEFPIFQERTPYYLTATTANPNMGDAVVVHLPDCSDNIARVLATPYTGCTFVNWTSNGIEVSTSANYEFSLESDINLIANFISDVDWDDPIVFADANVKAICVTHWDTNGDGELSYNEAMPVADIGSVFKGNTSITSFDELQYFRSLAQIGNEAFSGCSNLTTIKIPANVTVIRQLAFMNCQKLNISLSEHLTTIEWGAFAGCSHLNSITIPASVTSIERQAFAFCNNLQSVTVFATTPPSVVDNTFQSVSTSISVFVPCNAVGAYSAISWGGFSTFVGMCPGVITVTANPTEGGTVMGGGSFEGGTSCTVTATPNENYVFTSWTSNGDIVSFENEYTFYVMCDMDLVANFELNDNIIFADANVKAICVSNWDTNGDGELSKLEARAVTNIGTVFKRNTNITSFEELQYFTGLTNIPVGAFLGCRSLTSVMIPNSVTRIEGSAFNTCIALSSIVIPHSVIYMGHDAFTNCEGLTSMTILNEVPPTIEDVTFLFVDTSIPVYIPCGSYYSYSEAIFWNAFTNFIEICDSYHNITVNTNPIEGGMVTGMGSIGEGAVCRLTAIPNGGFSFANWTQDGMVVSTDNPYSFIVTEDATFVANFTFNGYEVTATSCPAIGGTIYGAGVFNQGATCTLTAIPNDGYSFIRWREGSETVCTDSIYSFLVSSPRNLVADFYFDDGSTGILSGVFSVSDNTQVHFSQGNLQYQASTSTWRFAESQWDYMGNGNANISSTYDGWIDLFCWGTSGYNHGAVCYQPWSSSQNDGDYYAYGSPNYNLFDQTGKADWGYNAISNGGNQENLWRSLTCEEWGYVLTLRTTTSGILYVKARVNNINGIILLPDDWDASYYSLSNTNTGNANYDGNIITASQWNTLEQHGAVFLPAAGYRMGTSLGVVNTGARYWSSSHQNNNYSLYMDFGTSYLYTQWGNDRYLGGSVRLVCSLQSNTTYSINATHYPEEGGSVTGCGDYAEGSTCTLTALANDGYTFNNWTENGNVVSTNAYYSFTVTGDRNLVANFLIQGNIPTGSTNGRFSVGDSLQVYFSQGNLQYQASTNTWRFALHQWDYVGEGNNNISDSYSGWIDLFCWGTSGYNHGANCYQPWSTSQNNSDYKVYGSYFYNLYDQTGQADWGYNAISNGGNTESLWRTLNKDEWDYVFNTRNTVSGIRWVQGKVDGKNGTILLPDNWDASLYPLNDANGGNFSSNTITTEDWNSIFEVNGAVFLPPSGRRLGNSGSYRGTAGDYWSSSYCNSNSVYYVYLGGGDVYTQGHTRDRKYGLAVRLVRNAESVVSYGINASPNPAEGGTVTGTGLYDEGTTCTLTAIPNEGYAFARWKEGDETVSTDNIFTFVVMANRDFVADFTPIGGTPGALNGVFSVSDTSQVHFSQGNLQYIGSAASPYWKFAENQWDILGITTGQNSSNQNVDRDLFGWGTSGYNHGAVCYQPWSISTTNGDYYAYGNSNFNLYDQTNQADWGYNAISNGGNTENIGWRTPTTDEWDYIFNTRTASTVNGIANARYAKAKVADVQGMILFPDNYTHPSEVTQPVGINSPGNAGWTGNNYSSADFALMESNGAVFLPAAGDRSGTSVIHIGTDASYWSSSRSDSNNAYHLLFYNSSLVQRRSVPRKDGDAVRLIIPVMNNSSYDINAAPNPAEGGTVTGTGLYDEGSTCTLTATANEGYTFTNWTENGQVVSTNSTYSFVVTANRTLEAVFTLNSYEITVAANPTEGGTVNGYGTYIHGQTCNLTATANENYTFTNWTENGEIVSTEASYSFTVTSDHNIVANFTTDYHWNVNIYNYSNSMTVVGIIRINEVEQTTNMLEIGAFCGDECRGRERLSDQYYAMLGHYYVFLTVYGDNDNTINFRLYDHSLGTELDFVCASMTFVTNNTTGNLVNPYVFDFVLNTATQTSSLFQGWNWWSTYINVEGYNSLGMLEEALGTNALQIKSQNGFAQYLEVPGYGGYWYGTLDTILSNKQTYMIQTSSNCQVEISGTPVSPADHPITILPGWNWIGFPSSTAISFTEAFAGFTPTDGDQVKSQSGFTQYMEIPGYGGIWYGGLETRNLTPGMGLMYKSMSTENATLVYPNAGRSVENAAYVEKHWTNDVHAYSGNMTLMAVVELDDVELASDNYELAAFADGECRGSAKLTYVVPLNRYFAFLTIAGDEATELYFSLYNHSTGEESFESGDVLVYTTDASVGSFNTPMVVRFRGTTGLDDLESSLHVYPNPVARGQRFSIGFDDIEAQPVRVEIINALGVTVAVETSRQMTAPKTAGVYMLRVFVEGKGTCMRKLVVK